MYNKALFREHSDFKDFVVIIPMLPVSELSCTHILSGASPGILEAYAYSPKSCKTNATF